MFSRRAVAASQAVVLLFLAVGIPLPVPRAAKDRSRPFICMDSVCGCRDAEMCWRECCCHTNAEKLAWARKHGVQPPAFVVAAARRELRETSKGQTGAPGGKSCCQKKSPSPAACCHRDKACEAHASTPECATDACATQATPAQPQAAATQWDFVLLSGMQHCQGGARFLWLGDWTALPAEVSTREFRLAPGEWLVILDHAPPDGELSPPTPPPRLRSAEIF